MSSIAEPAGECPEVVRATIGLRHWIAGCTRVPRIDLAPAYAYMQAAEAVSSAWDSTGAVPGLSATFDLLRLCQGLRDAYAESDLNLLPEGVSQHAVAVLTAHREALAGNHAS